MEGLFSHFFSADRRGYHEEDMRWFLELANQQDDWCVPHVSDIVIGGTSEQDLVDELQKSIYEKEKSRTATLTVEVCVILLKVHSVCLLTLGAPAQFAEGLHFSAFSFKLRLFKLEPRQIPEIKVWWT